MVIRNDVLDLLEMNVMCGWWLVFHGRGVRVLEDWVRDHCDKIHSLTRQRKFLKNIVKVFRFSVIYIVILCQILFILWFFPSWTDMWHDKKLRWGKQCGACTKGVKFQWNSISKGAHEKISSRSATKPFCKLRTPRRWNVADASFKRCCSCCGTGNFWRVRLVKVCLWRWGEQ